MYPNQVEVDEINIAKLKETFKKSYIEIIKEIEGATDFGVANRKAILVQIENILTGLGEDADAFIKKELPKYYKSGADDAIKQLKRVGVEDIPVSYGFNQIHKEAILALIDDTSRAFGESMTGVQRSAERILGKAVREQITQKIAEGQIGGKALKEVRQVIKGTIEEQGLSALFDKAGREWELDRYAEMLIRTKAVESRNRGMANRMAENGYDLVQVSDHPGACELCSSWAGEILSLTGATPGYPTVADAESDGLFHPNCKHALNVLVPELAELTSAYDPNIDTAYIDPADAKDVTTGKTGDIVYRAIDSTNKQATLGAGTYVGYAKDSVARYGDKIVAYALDKDTKLLELNSMSDIFDFEDKARNAMKDRAIALTDKYGSEQGLAKLVREYAQKLGYDGIKGDDSAFGTVVFDKSKIKQIAR